MDFSSEHLNEPIHHRRHIRITCIGAGASGLLFAYKVQKAFDNFSLVIYEKNDGLGGTWLENKYPGVACDYPSHNYTYTFEPKPDWPSAYVSGSQVRMYFEDFAKKYNLGQFCKTSHEVAGAKWVEEVGHWRLQILNLKTGKTTTAEAEVLINAAGVLNRAKWPNIPGLEAFQGRLMHSAKWDETVELRGKRVGLIGNGSSGQQILESIQPLVGHLTSFIRQGTWTFGPFGSDHPRDYTPSEITTFQTKPSTLKTLRKENESRINSSFTLFLSTSPEQSRLRSHLTAKMRAELHSHPELEGILIPTTGVGCRRPTPGLNYISAITSPNVTIAHGPIIKITSTGAISASDPAIHHQLDILICATGFDTSYTPHFPIINASGSNLQDEWSSSNHTEGSAAAAYFATAAVDFPNYMMFFGPGNPWASGSFLSMIEAQAEYMLKLIDRFQSENWHSFTPKKEAVEDLKEHSKTVLKDTVWAERCSSWYKQRQEQHVYGIIMDEKDPPKDDDAAERASEMAARLKEAETLNLWPGSGLHFIEALAEVRAEDWDIRYKGNRFAWLGNGFSRVEMDHDSDKAWYIRDNDEGGFVSREKRRKLRTSKQGYYSYGMSI